MNKRKQITGWLFLLACYGAGAQKNPCNPTGAPYTSLPGDTTIILKGGTQLTFNRCEYFDLRDCLEFDELVHPVKSFNLGLPGYATWIMAVAGRIARPEKGK